jgi:hypothetical protein
VISLENNLHFKQMARQPGTVRLEIAAPHVLPAGAGPGAVPPAPGPTYRIQINNILDNIGSESICICTDQNMRTDRCEYPPHNDEWFNQANGPPGLAGGVNGLQAVYNTANFVTGINDLTANNVGVTTGMFVFYSMS